MGIDKTQFVFDQIRNDVLVRSESRDIFIAQRRGAGKSTIAVRIATLLDPNFTLDHVCFTVSKFVHLITSRLKPGTVIIFDDLGTQKGGSSRKWQQKEAHDLADIMQLNRTDRIITIATSLELDRGEKRLRAGFSLMIDPGDKLSDEDTRGRGLANQIKLRQKVVDVFDGSVRWQYWRYKAGGRIVGINISHPSAQVWVKGYLAMREQYLQDVKEHRKDEIDAELTPIGTHKNAVDLAKMLGTQGKFIPSYRMSLTQMHNQKAVSKESGISQKEFFDIVKTCFDVTSDQGVAKHRKHCELAGLINSHRFTGFEVGGDGRRGNVWWLTEKGIKFVLRELI